MAEMSPRQRIRFLCHQCQREFPVRDPRWKCDCGGVLDLDFKPLIDLKKLEGRPPTLWRYREVLPVEDDGNIVSFDEGFTPLQKISLTGGEAFFKVDCLFPSGSFKDRGSSILVSKLKEWGIREVVEDSSGNAGSSLAGYCARAGIGCHIYVPRSTSPAKCTQIEAYGAVLHRVPGSREAAARAALEAAGKTYYASHVWNPFFSQGTKTFAYEVCEQLDWRAPDWLAAAVGNGSLLLGAFTGFTELLAAGIIKTMPRLLAFQAEACAPLAEAFMENSTHVPLPKKRPTAAEGIAVAAPKRGRQILDAVRQSGGRFMTIAEAEIKESLRMMWRQGYYIEPTSAVAVAGVEKFLRQEGAAGLVVSTLTGHGLKASG